MNNLHLYLLVAVSAIMTYIIRVVPLTIFRKKIKSPFIKDILEYMPYAVIAAMTVPAVFTSAGSIIPSTVGAAVAVILALWKKPFIAVSISAAASAYICILLMKLF